MMISGFLFAVGLFPLICNRVSHLSRDHHRPVIKKENGSQCMAISVPGKPVDALIPGGA